VVELTPRRQIERELGRPLAEETWSWLEEQGYTDPELYSPEEVADIVRTVGASFRQAVPARLIDEVGPRLVPGAELLDERAQAIAAWVALAATGDSGVRRFRMSHLGDGLLQAEEIHAWVVARYQINQPAEWPLVEPEVTETELWKAMTLGRSPLHPVPHAVLHWMEPSLDGEWTARRWPVPPRSPLARLADLSDSLVSKYRWDKYEATAWVLTGLEPYVGPISASATVGASYAREVGTYDVLSRVTIAVDPTVSPEQLAAWWRHVRHRMLPKRYRPQQVKALRLARFVAACRDETTWDDERRRWNAEVAEHHPEWSYEDVANFRRHAKEAVERLLYLGLQLP
jgi:hypothetical protein